MKAICSSETFPYLVKSKRPDAVRGQLHRVQQRDLNESVRLRPSVGPVLVTLHLKHTNTHCAQMRPEKERQAGFSTRQRVTDAIITVSSALSLSQPALITIIDVSCIVSGARMYCDRSKRTKETLNMKPPYRRKNNLSLDADLSDCKQELQILDNPALVCVSSLYSKHRSMDSCK